MPTQQALLRRSMPHDRQVVLVTHEYTPFPGGIATYVSEIEKTLAKRRIYSSVLAPYYGEVDGRMQPPSRKLYRVFRHHSLSLKTAMAALWLLWKHRSNSFLHATDVRSAIVLRIFKSLTNHPYAVTIHGSEVSKLGKRSIGGSLASWSYRSAAVIFANSDATKQLFLKNVPCTVPIRVTHLGVDSQWFQSPPERFEHEVLASIDGKTDIISAVGRVEDRKGHLCTLEAMKRLVAEPGFETIVYVIAGTLIDQAYAADLERRAASLGVRCVMTGPLSAGDLRRLYHRSICHTLTALTVEGKIEGFGLVALEAAAQGCPTIATRVGGIVEVVRDGQTGLLCPEGNSAAITAALRKMVLDAPYRQRVSGNCRGHAAEFTWNRCVEVTYGGVVSGLSA